MKLKKCKYCNGTGKIYKKLITLKDYHKTGTQCPKCYGKGVK